MYNQARQAIEELLLEFQEIFTGHRFDIGIKNDLKVKMTPILESPAYSQDLPTPINLKQDVTRELALLHKYSLLPLYHSAKRESDFRAKKTER